MLTLKPDQLSCLSKFHCVHVFLFVSTTLIWDSCSAITTHLTPVPLLLISKWLIAEIRAKSCQSCAPVAGWGSGVYLWRSAVSRAKLWMTSSPVQWVPDRCITRLWHTRQNTERGSRRLKAESHSNKLHSISPSSLPVLGSLFPLDVCFISIFSTVSPALFYPFFLWVPMLEPFSASVCLKKLSLWTSFSARLFSISCFYSPACFSLIFSPPPTWDGGIFPRRWAP